MSENLREIEPRRWPVNYTEGTFGPMVANVDAAKKLATRAIAHYLPGIACEVTLVKYRENYVFRVREPDGSYALRVHRSGYLGDAQILEELQLLQTLAAAGIRVPRVCSTATGELMCRVTDDDGRVYQIDMTEWVPDAAPLGDVGEAFTGIATVDPADFHALGGLIAKLHNTTAALGRSTPTVRPRWDAGGLIGDRAVWGDPRRVFTSAVLGGEIVEQAMAHLADELRVYGITPDRFGPIHADFTPENVLVRGGQMTVIDFDDSGYGYYLFDLATAAFFYLPHPRGKEVVSALLAGYREIRPLTDEDLALWRPITLARGLTYLAWAADRPGDETSNFILEHVLPLVVTLATEYVESTTRR